MSEECGKTARCRWRVGEEGNAGVHATDSNNIDADQSWVCFKVEVLSIQTPNNVGLGHGMTGSRKDRPELGKGAEECESKCDWRLERRWS